MCVYKHHLLVQIRRHAQANANSDIRKQAQGVAAALMQKKVKTCYIYIYIYYIYMHMDVYIYIYVYQYHYIISSIISSSAIISLSLYIYIYIVLVLLLVVIVVVSFQKKVKTAHMAKVIAMLETSENPFKTVLEEIEKMLVIIKKEEKADKEQFAWCNEERSTNDDEKTRQIGIKNGLEADISKLNEEIDNPETGLKARTNK